MKPPPSTTGDEPAAVDGDGPQPGSGRWLELLWCALLVGVPLGAGLAFDAWFGWWPGLAAFLLAAVITGIAAHRTDPRRSRH